MFTRMRLTIPVRLTGLLHHGTQDLVETRVVDRRGKKNEFGEDREFSMNASHEYVLRGTAIAGALKSACKIAYGDEHARAWGSSERPSLIAVDDALLAGGSPDRRTGNAINRYSGSVTDGSLFHHGVFPRGTRFTIILHAETRSPEDAAAARDALRACVQLIGSGAVAVGRRPNHRRGSVELKRTPPLETEDLHTVEGLARWLSGKPESEVTEAASSAPDSGVCTIELVWSPISTVFVGAAAVTRAQDEHAIASGQARNVVTPLMENGLPVVPGSSIRGVLRQRAARIARTVLANPDGWEDVTTHLQLATEPEIVQRLFGDTRRQGALRTHDSRAATRATVTADHVAIDRWTGGALDGERGAGDEARGGHLFSVQEAAARTWEPIRLDLRLDRLGSDAESRRASLCLLCLVLAELCTGHLTLGGHATRGSGLVAVQRLTWTPVPGLARGPEDGAYAGAWESGATDSVDPDDIEALTAHSREVARDLLARARALQPECGWAEVVTRADRERASSDAKAARTEEADNA